MMIGEVMGGLFSPKRLALLCVATVLSAGQPAFAEVANSTGDEDISLFGSYLAGRHAIATRDRESAAKFFSQSLKLDPEHRILLERTFAYQVSSGDIQAALEGAPRVLVAAPKNLGANLLLGLKAFGRQDYAGARRFFAQPDRGPIAKLVTGLLTAWTYQAQGQFQKAIETVEAVGNRDATRSFQKYQIALMTDLEGDVEATRKAYGEAMNIGSDALRTVQAAGRFEERAGERDAAIEIYEKFLARLPRHPSILAALKRMEAGQVPTRLVPNAQTGMAEALYTIGSALTQDSGGDLALVYLHLALYLRPDYPVAQFLIADILDRQQRLEKSIEMYAMINPDSPLKREARIQRALNLDQLERTDEAKTALDAIIAEDPADISALESTANMLRLRMRYGDAEPYYTRAVALTKNPGRSDWRLYYSRAITFERLKKWPQAEKDFLKALELNPDQPLVLNYLGYTWIDQGVKLERALKMVRKAVEQRPNDGYIVDSLGWAYYQMGRYEEAVKELERATELRADDPVINDHLGDAYWRVGRRLEARFQWSQALEMDPEKDQIDLIKEKFKSGLPEASHPPGVKPKNPSAQTGGPDAPAPKKPTESNVQPAPSKNDVAGMPAGTSAPKTTPVIHTVRAGESLWDIARKYFGAGSAYQRIFKANRQQLKRAGRIYPGQTLVLPGDN